MKEWKKFGNYKIITRNSLSRRISESFVVGRRVKQLISANPILTLAYTTSLDRFNTLINRMRKSGCRMTTDFQGVL